MCVYIVYIEQTNSSNRKIGPQYYIISFYSKGMPMLNELVYKVIQLKKSNTSLSFHGSGLPAQDQFLILKRQNLLPLFC